MIKALKRMQSAALDDPSIQQEKQPIYASYFRRLLTTHRHYDKNQQQNNFESVATR